MRKYKAVILGYYGFGNLGDELLLSACLEMMTRCGLGRESVAVLSSSPDETSQKFGVKAVNRWSLREVVKVLRESESLLLGGGGLFQDTTSVKSCVWYWGLVRLARMLGCRVWAIGQSVGPLESGVSRVLAGNALKMCEVVHVRDDKSLSLAESLGCKNVMRGSDLVMTLPADAGGWVGMLTVKACQAGSILVNLRPCERLESFVKILAPVIANANIPVIGAALSDDDVNAMHSLSLHEVVRVKSFRDAAELWSKASCAVGMRLHFGVLSRIFRTPLALMPYDEKVSSFASQSGVPCIIDEWREPVMPLPVPECSHEIDSICRKILAL